MSSADIERVQEILKQYGVESRDITVLGGAALSSKVFKVVTDEHTYVAKESRWYAGFTRNPAQALETIYTVIEALKATGVAMQGAIRTAQNTFTYDLGDSQWCVLEYIEGRSFSGEPKDWELAGRALGILHARGKQLFDTEPGFAQNLLSIPSEKPYEESRAMYAELAPVLLSEHTCSHPDTCEVVRANVKALENAMEYVDSALTGNSTTSVLHNDFNAENGIYGKETFSGFIDADQIGHGPVIHDIGNALASLVTFCVRSGRIDIKDRVMDFIRAYHAEFPLEHEEYMRIPAGAMRWDLTRLLRSLRRHHFENDRLSGLLEKIPTTTIPRILSTRSTFAFLQTFDRGAL